MMEADLWSYTVNGISAPLGATAASLSFPLQHFLTILSSSQYLNWFVCFTVTFPSPPPTDEAFPFYSPILCSLRLCLDVSPS